MQTLRFIQDCAAWICRWDDGPSADDAVARHRSIDSKASDSINRGQPPTYRFFVETNRLVTDSSFPGVKTGLGGVKYIRKTWKTSSG